LAVTRQLHGAGPTTKELEILIHFYFLLREMARKTYDNLKMVAIWTEVHRTIFTAMELMVQVLDI
jgi:hypothetical protein